MAIFWWGRPPRRAGGDAAGAPLTPGPREETGPPRLLPGALAALGMAALAGAGALRDGPAAAALIVTGAALVLGALFAWLRGRGT
jgi:hypothetical protein